MSSKLTSLIYYFGNKSKQTLALSVFILLSYVGLCSLDIVSCILMLTSSRAGWWGVVREALQYLT